MKCKITCQQPKPGAIILKKHSLLKGDKEVAWQTDDDGVTYKVHVPPNIFEGCTAVEGCDYLVKKGQEAIVQLAPGAKKSIGEEYTIAIAAGTLPKGCKAIQPQDPPVIIVEDLFVQKKKVAKKAAAKQKAMKKPAAKKKKK